ncbi:hypothetical protein IGS68_00640 [Skermanella sp. TT6]|uniref:Putative endonuclease Z1 domain-containing protein n=1 Tax=Skermanella cutis TaxID=2775420 RepID=A0ABX7BBK7_9PROT|nr:Z1 domain-containing protein [Skermanella sp. TT6]QQP89822.1 hypothetical protein IGS68_00640 [Skermanella sp. TT6]
MRHREQIRALLEKQIGNPNEVKDIVDTAEQVMGKWVDPLSGGKEEINGLIYGLVQSGKTGVLTVTGAIGADEGYKAVIVLTSDNDPLYDQTLARVREAFPGMDIIAKPDFKDYNSFIQRVKHGTCAIVTTKNASILDTLIENFKKGNIKGLTSLIIDDEADQASLNTKEAKADGTRSEINRHIGALRKFFDKNTYLQVTATPQALFLQSPGHDFRPQFTVLSHPGKDYVGGEDFFGGKADLVREFDITDITAIAAGNQPAANPTIPKSLLRALDTFMVAATYKRLQDTEQKSAFLCHVSTRKADHKHIEGLLRQYKVDLSNKLKAKDKKTINRLKNGYDDLAKTDTGLAAFSFVKIVDEIEFLSPGIAVKLVNGETDEDVALQSPYNLFVGGNKLGRGVTIKNLLVSYYGRNPKVKQADTVLQHARMYGYRRTDIGLLRLFLPPQLHLVFKAIHEMEDGLRKLISSTSTEHFRGIYLDGGVSPTRRNILAPGTLGVYSAGKSYNPANVLRDASVKASTARIDGMLAKVADKTCVELPIADVKALIEATAPDPAAAQKIWDTEAILKSLDQLAGIRKQKTAYVYVDRGRGLKENRHETQGILTGGEEAKAPKDKATLFLLRTDNKSGAHEAWWPQFRFPDGSYAFAFAI